MTPVCTCQLADYLMGGFVVVVMGALFIAALCMLILILRDLRETK